MAPAGAFARRSLTTARILWVSAEPPDFRLGGGGVRQAQLIDGLVRRFGPVDLLLAGRLEDQDLRGRLGAVSELPIPERRRPRSVGGRRGHDLWRVTGARLPAEVYDRREERLALWNALSGSGSEPNGVRLNVPYDIVHVEHLGLAGVVPVRAAVVDGLRSLGVQNIPSRMAEQAASLAPGGRQRWLLGAEATTARRFQQRAMGYADVVSVVSAEDGAELVARPGRGRRRGPGIPPAELPPAGVPFGGPTPAGRRRSFPDGPEFLVAPNGVDEDRLRPTPLPAEPRLVFTGTLDYLPNVDGITWFARDVLPLVRQEVPGVRLDVAGRSPVPEVAALGGLEGVEVHADVADMAVHLAAARVVVAPVRIGTGSRLKVLEAMAAGRPVASTRIGAEGLAVESGRHLLVADDADQLSAAIVLLCRDDGLAGKLAAGGRRLIEERYSWRAIADEWAGDLDRLLRARR